MPSGKALFSLSAFLAGLCGVQAGLDLQSSDNVAVYWGTLPVTQRLSYILTCLLGQNSYGQSTGPYVQQRLSYYCQSQ